ncbi:hypothetical protein WA026_003758 [Henosepilachna vigintioctopunctata]|uniref:Nucleoprotein n=1 Tax=Henosepilachna vigintioctopunctata TaxID=420089 RepID=A0AAW1U5K7_9CUCU
MSSAGQVLNEILLSIEAGSISMQFDRQCISKTLRDPGFNVVKIRERVMKHVKNNSSDGPTDILKLVMLGMCKGNKVSTIIKSSSDQTKNWLFKMVTELEIKDEINYEESRSNSTSNADKLTLSRLRIAMPQLAYKALKFPNFQRQVTLSHLTSILPSFNKMLSIARDMCIVSLLPNFSTEKLPSDIKKIIVSHVFLYCVAETFVFVDPYDQNSSLDDRISRVTKYMNIFYNATHVTRKMREDFSMDVTTYVNKFDGSEKALYDNQNAAIEEFAANYGVNLVSMFSSR